MEGGKGPRLVRLGAPFLTKGNRYLWRNSSRHRPDCRMAWAYSRRHTGNARVVNNPRLLLLVRGIAKNEAVLPAVLHQPLLDRGVLLGSVQHLILGVHNVHGQAQLVLAGAGTATSLAALAMASDRLFPRAICFCTRLL